MSDAFTPERIAQLREILARATPGEWASNSKKEVGPISTVDDHSHGMLIACADAWSRPDAAAIVAAVNTLPAALDEIERLQTEVSAESRLCTQAYRKLSDAHAEYAAATALHDVTKDELSRVKAENARLREALRGALNWSEELASEDRSAYGRLRYGLAAGLRRARAALAGQGDGE